LGEEGEEQTQLFEVRSQPMRLIRFLPKYLKLYFPKLQQQLDIGYQGSNESNPGRELTALLRSQKTGKL